jgi:TRAP transporter TAXI family solute receptor
MSLTRRSSSRGDRFRFTRLALTAALCACPLVAGTAHAQKATDVIFSAGPTGGSWTPMAATISQVMKKAYPELNVQVEPGAALVNMEKIRTDKADLGWSMTNVMADAQAGTGAFQGKQTAKALYVANFYPNVWQLLVPENSGVKSIKDLKGKAVALPSRGNTSLTGWEYVLQVNGMTLNDLGTKSFGPIASNTEAIKNRQAVAMGWFTVVPASFVMDLGSATKLRMVPISDAEFAGLQKINRGFARYTVKGGIYNDQGISADVQTFQSPTVLVASEKTPADVIYKITKGIVEGRDAFAAVAKNMQGVSAKDMAENFGMKYHPGAAKYYKEAGLIK